MSEMRDSVAVEVPPLTLGWRLQMAMAHAGLTRYYMADAMGVGISTITRWTSDKSEPKKAFLAQWAWLTKVPMEWLENGTMPPSPIDGTDVTTHGYSTDPLPFPVSPVNPDAPGSHELPWQVVTPLTASVSTPNLPGGGIKSNDQDDEKVRLVAQAVSATEDIESGSRVAA